MSYHLYDIVELYSNHDGSVQFVELAMPAGASDQNGEGFWNNHRLVSTDGVTTKSVTFTNLPSTSATQHHHVLVATANFQALTGITPNFIIPANFLFTTGGTVSFGATNGLIHGSGWVDDVVYTSLPADHENSLNIAIDTTHAQSTGANSPQNFADASGHFAFNIAPVIGAAITDKLTGGGQAVNFSFSPFTDVDADTVSYTATLSNDAALPGWLGFDSGTRTFSGTPLAANQGTITVKVTASDGFGGTATDLFNIKVIPGHVINGTAGIDNLGGTTKGDSISGLGGNDVLSGGDGNDTIKGGAGNDSIAGNAGADSLVGGAGADTMSGGLGNDKFVFAEAPSPDVITDFTGGADKLVIDNVPAFAALVETGAIGDRVQVGLRTEIKAVSGDTNDFLKYATDTHQLYYDADGSGPGLIKLVATITSSGPLFDPAVDITVV